MDAALHLRLHTLALYEGFEAHNGVVGGTLLPAFERLVRDGTHLRQLFLRSADGMFTDAGGVHQFCAVVRASALTAFRHHSRAGNPNNEEVLLAEAFVRNRSRGA